MPLRCTGEARMTVSQRESSGHFRDFREFPSISEGFHSCERAELPFPFVVRTSKANVKGWPTLETIREQLSREKGITGYSGPDGKQTRLTGQQTLACYDDNTMVQPLFAMQCMLGVSQNHILQVSSRGPALRTCLIYIHLHPPPSC